MSIGTFVTYKRHDGLFSHVLQFSGRVVNTRMVELAPGVQAERFQVEGNHGERVLARKEELSEQKGGRTPWQRTV